MPQGDYRICFALGEALPDRHAVDDALWARAEGRPGARKTNEILGLLGLYTAVCATMVAYRVPTKQGEPDPFA